jgi:hypothetical protein
MDKLHEKFWQQRYSQISNEIELNIKSIYTWALLLDQSIDKRNQWVKDKKMITGNNLSINTHDNNVDGKLLAKYVVDYALGLGVKNINTLKHFTNSNTVDDETIEIECDDDNFATNTVENTNDNTVENTNDNFDANEDNNVNLNILAESVLKSHEQDQEDLAKLMEDRRISLGKINSRENNLEEKTPLVKFLLKTVSECESMTVNKGESMTVNKGESMTVGDGESMTVGDGESMTVGDGESMTVGDGESMTIDDIVKIDNNQVKKISNDKPFNCPPLDTREDSTYKLAGPQRPSPNSQARNAPTVTVLHSLRKNDLEKLLYDIFQQATRNVNSMMRGPAMKENDIEELIHKETDRLLQAHINKKI